MFKKIMKEIVNKDSVLSNYSHKYVIMTKRDGALSAILHKTVCFGRLKTYDIVEASLVAEPITGYKDVLVNYFGDIEMEVAKKRYSLYRKFLKGH